MELALLDPTVIKYAVSNSPSFTHARRMANMCTSLSLSLSNTYICSYEPVRALDGGEDGLCAYRQLACSTRLVDAMAEGSTLLLEIGQGQRDQVSQQ